MSLKLSIALWISLYLPLALAQGQAVGSYDNGYLINASCLPAEGEGYMQLFRDVGRIWGTWPLVQTIVCAADRMNDLYPDRDRLQVEDMSAREGGDIPQHGSHENGLDVDLQYFKADGREHIPTVTQRYAPPMVTGGRVSENFDVQRNWELVKTLHRCGSVGRIFMDQALKDRLCRYARSINEFSSNVEVLRSIRHVPNHADHLHLRLNCPRNSRRCRPQAPPPPGSGCPRERPSSSSGARI